MGLSKENLKGLILALVSSGFIGASFIIKKQGLRRAAAASGVRAGEGISHFFYENYNFYLEACIWLCMILFSLSFCRCWWVLLSLGATLVGGNDHKICFCMVYCTVIVGEVANFVAYAFAPAVLVTPLGALSIIVSAVLADFILKEKLHNLGILGCVMCIAGSIIIVIHAPKEQPIKSVLEIWNMATQPAFLAYVGSVIVLVFILVFHFAPRCGHTNVLVFTGICSLMGSLSVMSVKALGTSLKLTFEGKNQLIYPETWFFMLVVAICVIMQMNYLNKALDTFNTAIVSPIYYVMFTTLTILASVIMFKDWDGQSGGTIVSEICGFVVVLSGTVMLHATKDFERGHSFRGTGPSSPTLSTRLYTGNGDFLAKQDEESGSPDSSVCSRRQESY